SRRDYLTLAYTAFAGTKLWTRRYNGPENLYDIAHSLAASPDGSKLYVTGHSLGSASSIDYATITYDASTGARLWARRYNGPGNFRDFASSLAPNPNGTALFVTGWSFGSGSGYDYATIAYAA